MNLIAAVDNNWGIGKGQDLLFHIPEDMQFFKAKTKGHPVVMGRKTFESIGKPLPQRENIILTTNTQYHPQGCTVINSIPKLIEYLSNKYAIPDIYIIGGEMIYQKLLPYCDIAYITKIYETKDADKFFPNLDEKGDWHIASQSEMKEYQGIKYQFLTYHHMDFVVAKQ